MIGAPHGLGFLFLWVFFLSGPAFSRICLQLLLVGVYSGKLSENCYLTRRFVFPCLYLRLIFVDVAEKPVEVLIHVFGGLSSINKV